MSTFQKFILASRSPHRKGILEKAGFDFSIFIPKAKELDITGKKYTDKLLLDCCKSKSENALKELKDQNINSSVTIVSCDTVVVLDNTIIGKPKDRDDAISTLKSLSNRTHLVISAVCILYYQSENLRYKTGIEKTSVTFKDLTISQIESYIDKCKPYDKAGSYGIQDEGFDFVKSVVGNTYNVIGFPLETFRKLL